MKKSLYLLAFAMLSFLACNNEQSHSESDEHSHEEEGSHDDGDHEHDTAPAATKRDIEATANKNTATTGIIDGYLQIKNGLVADDKDKAAAGANALLVAFKGFDMAKLSTDQHKEYMEILENAQEQAEHITKNPIDHQREHFEVLSTDIKDMIALLGTDKTLYEVFCPMANDGKGAIWLSEVKEIKNPYMGSKMMTCGEIKNQIN
jgi:Protein of unknown function (DUF3347)